MHRKRSGSKVWTLQPDMNLFDKDKRQDKQRKKKSFVFSFRVAPLCRHQRDSSDTDDDAAGDQQCPADADRDGSAKPEVRSRSPWGWRKSDSWFPFFFRIFVVACLACFVLLLLIGIAMYADRKWARCPGQSVYICFLQLYSWWSFSFATVWGLFLPFKFLLGKLGREEEVELAFHWGKTRVRQCFSDIPFHWHSHLCQNQRHGTKPNTRFSPRIALLIQNQDKRIRDNHWHPYLNPHQSDFNSHWTFLPSFFPTENLMTGESQTKNNQR